MKQFFSRLSYSFGNEDWQTEKEALKIQPNDRIVCVTASGDRPLNLLLNECKEIAAVDLNPIQNYLLNLKMAAMEHLDYKEYLAFLGVNASNKRAYWLKHLSSHLPEPARAYWKRYHRKIENGILYQGTMERSAFWWAKAMGVWRKKKIAKLFQFDDISEQQQFVNKEWNSFIWKKTFEIMLHPKVSKLWINDPGLYAHLGPTIHPGLYLYQRINTSLNRHLAKENPVLSILFQGYVSKEAFPPYLTLEGTQNIRPRLGKIAVHDYDLIGFLNKQHDNYFDCYSISDVASYLNPQQYQHLLNAIFRTARPGARFCLRQFLSGYTIPDKWKGNFCRDTQLEKQLEAQDKTVIYRFMVGTIRK